ncbi:hypothetical protein SSTG_05075 [Streptomyces sp. e14]|nr:hypothetical protein SSTG_05075 [Streptomyces sp. e14]
MVLVLVVRRAPWRPASQEGTRCGDSLGQVAGQTPADLVAVDEAAALPVLRPRIGREKQETEEAPVAGGGCPAPV